MANSNRLRRVLETGVSVAALSVLAAPAVAQTAAASGNSGQTADAPGAGVTWRAGCWAVSGAAEWGGRG